MNIEDVLADRYCMFLTTDYRVDKLTPGQTLTKSIDFVNQTLDRLGRDLTTWNSGEQDEIARLMWVNVICRQLPIEPIRKPILVHAVDDNLVVDCGDTRIMALLANNTESTVSVVVTCLQEQACYFSDWIPVRHNQELTDILQFDPGTTTLVYRAAPPSADYAIEWLEIGDQSTSHHLHSISQRVNMMQNFLTSQPANFEFDLTWPHQGINWNALYHTV
jgi:hypothetical protein